MTHELRQYDIRQKPLRNVLNYHFEQKTVGCYSGKKAGPDSDLAQILAGNFDSGTTSPISIAIISTLV